MSDAISEDARESARATATKRTPQEDANNDAGSKAAWGALFLLQEQLKAVGIELEEKSVDGVWLYTLVQRYGPFSTRGEALQYALKGLADIKALKPHHV